MRGLAAADRDFAVERAVPAALAVGDVRFLAVEPWRARLRVRAAGFAGAGRVLERGDAARERLDLRAQALEVLEHADVLDHLAHAAGRAGHLVDEILGARAGGLRAVGRRLERALDRGAHRADRVGRLVGLLGLLLVLLRHEARKSSSIAPPVATAPVHLKPNAPVAERALLPGDPGRALRLAQHLLAAPMQVLNTNRGLWGYTGTAADGAPLTIQSTGMGGPSAAIVAEELIALGARRLVRVGTCGALVDGPRLGDLLVAREALCEDGASRALGAEGRVVADAGLCAALAGAAGDDPVVIVSADLFYDPDPDRPGRWTAAGAVAVEMEAAALFTVARLRGAAAGCVLLVSDELAGEAPRRIGDDELTRGELALGEAGLAGLRSLALLARRRALRLGLRPRLARRGGGVDLEALLLARHVRR